MTRPDRYARLTQAVDADIEAIESTAALVARARRQLNGSGRSDHDDPRPEPPVEPDTMGFDPSDINEMRHAPVAAWAALRASDPQDEVPAEEDDDDPFAGWPDGRIDGMFTDPPPPVEHFCRDRLVAGRAHALVGMGGSHKTRLLYHLGIGAVTGLLPWNWEVERTGSAVLFLTEDTKKQVHRALHALGRSLSPNERELLHKRLRVFPLAGMRARLLELDGNALRVSDTMQWFDRKLAEMPKPLAFIGIDPALGVSEGDELSQAHQRRLGELVDHLAIQSGACVVLTTHASKGILTLDEVLSHSSRGGGAITDAVRGEFVLRNMTVDEGRKHGITDIVERKRYVQLVGTKGNELPPEAFAPIWLRRSDIGLEQVTLDEVMPAQVGKREREALALLIKSTDGGESTLRFWRDDCVAAGIINERSSDEAKDKTIQRIRDVLMQAGLIRKGSVRGCFVPV